MSLSRKDSVWLGAVIAIAILFSWLLRTQAPLGDDVSGNALALAVRNDHSSPAEGGPAADLTLILFSDYRCPACRPAHSAMKRAVARDGKVRIVYKDWPIFGPASERAAQVAIASDFQDIYPLVHDRLMTGRVDGDDALKAAVKGSGGDWGRLRRDLTNRRSEIAAQLANNRMQAVQLGLGGTPGYLIGPILIRGALSESEFRRVFKQARKSASLRRIAPARQREIFTPAVTLARASGHR